MIAIQMTALEIGDILTLTATQVLNLPALGTEEDDEPGEPTDRNWWIGRGSQTTVTLADELAQLINEITPGTALKFNKYYIGLTRHGNPDNFVAMRARKDVLTAEFRIDRNEDLSALVENSGIDTMGYNNREGRYRLRLRPGDIATYRDLLIELTRQASGTPPPESDLVAD